MPLNLPYSINPTNPVPVDGWSGPYTASTIQDALLLADSSIPSAVRFISMEVRIVVNDVPYKYWYYGGLSSSNLLPFNSPLNLTTYGNSGSSTYSNNILNIPTYTLGGLGGQPLLNGSGIVSSNYGIISYINGINGGISYWIDIKTQTASPNLTWTNNTLQVVGNIGVFSNKPTRQLVLNSNPSAPTQSAQSLISYQRFGVEKGMQGLAGFDDNGFKGVKAGDFIYKGTNNVHWGFAQSAGGGDQYGVAPAKVNPAITINSSNYIGINDANPVYQLDIIGDVSITGGTYSTTRIDYLSTNDYYFFPYNTITLTRSVTASNVTINSTSTSNFVWFGTTQVLSNRSYLLTFSVINNTIVSPIVNIYYKINDIVSDSGVSLNYGNGNYTLNINTPNNVKEIRIYFNRLKSGSFTLTAFSLLEYQGNGRIIVNPAKGLSPIITGSTALNTNLNADLLDGYNSTDFSLSTHTHNSLYDNTLQSNGVIVDNSITNINGNVILNKTFGLNKVVNGTFSTQNISSFAFSGVTYSINNQISITTNVNNINSFQIKVTASNTLTPYRVRFRNVSSTHNTLAYLIYYESNESWDTNLNGINGITYSVGSNVSFEFTPQYIGVFRVYPFRNIPLSRVLVFDDIFIEPVLYYGDISANKFIKNGSTSTQFLMGDGSVTTLKTINTQSLLGVGNITIESGVTSFNGRTGSVIMNITDIKNADTNIELVYKGTNSYIIDKNGNFLNATYSLSSSKLVYSGDDYLYIDRNGILISNPSVTATSNYQQLVAYDIVPTFIAGSFSGTNNTALRVQNGNFIVWGDHFSNTPIQKGVRIQFSGGAGQIGSYFNSSLGSLSYVASGHGFNSAVSISGNLTVTGVNANFNQYVTVAYTGIAGGIRSLWSGALGNPSDNDICLYSNTGKVLYFMSPSDFRFINTSSTELFRIYSNTGNVVMQNGGSYTDNGYKLQITGISQSVSSANGIISLSQTWNTSGSPTAILLNVNNIDVGSSARLLDLQVGSVSQFNILRDGTTLLGTSTTNGVDKLQVNGSIISSGYKTSTGTSNDVLLADGTTITRGVLANSSASAKNICMVQTII